MWSLSVCFLFICVSAAHLHDRRFYYAKQMSIFRRHSEEECRVCFGHDCVPLTEAKCQYYMAASELQNDVDDDDEVLPNNELQVKVDEMIYDFLDVTQQYDALSCIPMLSYYTDCHKENQCTGCTTCACEEGRWVCAAQECHAERLDFGRQLTVALASLKSLVTGTLSENPSRRKRSTNKTGGNDDFETNITFEELAQWMNDTTRLRLDDNVVSGSYILEPTTETTNPAKKTTTSSDDLAFEEVLSNIALDNNKIRRKKPKLEPVDGDYVSFKDIVAASMNTSDVHTNKYTDKVEIGSKRIIDGNSFKVDLLENLKDRLERQFTIENNTGIMSQYTDTVAGIDKVKQNNFEINNYLDDVNSLGIVKREVSNINDSNVVNRTEQTIEEIAETNADTMIGFKNDILYPLINIINDKDNELNQLLGIKNSLIDLIKGMDSNFTLDMANINSTAKNKTLFSIYKLEIVPETSAVSEEHLDTRRFGRITTRKVERNDGKKPARFNVLDMYLQKLRHDVFQIIKDLKEIKLALNSKKLPKDLSMLLRGLNYYVRSQGKSFIKNYRHLTKLRRFLPDESKTKRMALELLELYDKEGTPQGSLNQLSGTTKGILQRIVKQNQIDDFVTYGVKISDPENSITKDLKSIGSKWPQITDNFLRYSPSDKLYSLKLLHTMLTVDIDKMTNAVKLLSFAQNRRVDLDTTLSNEEMTRVQNDITDLNDKVQKYVRKDYSKTDETRQTNYTEMLEEPVKRRSFMKQIKNLFKSSRRDVQNMLHNKVSKSDIVKELAKNKLEELAKKKMIQYEDTLKKWQTKLAVKSKRSVNDFRQFKSGIKNILPSYLRGKVTPAISKMKLQTRRYVMHNKTEVKEKAQKVTGRNNKKPTVTHKSIIPKANIAKRKEKRLRANKGRNNNPTTVRLKATTPHAETSQLVKNVLGTNTKVKPRHTAFKDGGTGTTLKNKVTTESTMIRKKQTSPKTTTKFLKSIPKLMTF